MRMYLAAIWVDNAMEDKFMSISNTFHFDPNCLMIFTGYCEWGLSQQVVIYTELKGIYFLSLKDKYIM